MKCKRPIILLSAVLMLCLAWNLSAAAANDPISYSVLCDLGIYNEDNGAYDTGRAVTRGEFAGIAARLSGAEVPDTAGRAFGDVPAGHKYYSDIAYVMSMGILKGDEYGSFRPDENMKYEEILAVVIRILGYEPVVEMSGTYPDAYVRKANELGLLSGASGTVGSDMVFGSMTEVLYNALETDCCTMDISKGSPEYHVKHGNDLLWQNFNTVKVQGIVTGNYVTRLTSPSAMPEDTIEIDHERYVCTDEEAYSLLGHAVEFYYEDNKDGKILKHIHSRVKTELTIEADRIESVDGESYKYYISQSSSSTKKAAFSKQADIIYNGKAASDVDGKMIPKSGEVRLIDNDFDGRYDVIFIDDYMNIVVGSINWNNYTVYDKYNPARKIELRDSGMYNRVTVTDRSGMSIPFDELREWDVLSVAATEDGGGYARVIVNYDEFSGTVTTVGTDSNDRTTYTIDGKVYSVSADMPDSAKPVNVLNKQVTVGLNFLGNISYIKTDSTGQDNMGYLMEAKFYQEDSGDDTLRLRVFCMNGEELVLYGADKIKVDGRSITKLEAYYELLKEGNNTKNGIIVFQTNSDGELTGIDTAYGYNEKPASGESKDSIHLLYPKSKLRYKRNMKSFGGKLCISSETVFLYVPFDKTEARQYRFLDVGYFVNDDDYEVEAYAVDSESLSAEILIVHGSGAEAIDGSSAPILVEKCYITVNEDGDTVHYLCGYSLDKDKGYQELYAVDDGVLAKVNSGDVIRCGLDSRGDIEKIEWVYDMKRDRFGAYADPENDEIPENHFGSIGNFTDQYRAIFGAVYKKSGDYISVITDDKYSENAEKEVFPASGFKIYKVEAGKSKVYITEIDAAELIDYKSTESKDVSILMYTRYAEPKTIVVFDNT